MVLAVLAVHWSPAARDGEPGHVVPAGDLAHFRLAESGLRIELVAAEPMVVAPVAMSFDERGRLWVVEMDSFMPTIDGRGELAPINRIVILEDMDGDGRMDRSTTFLDGLVLPRAVLPCFGGALVLVPPRLLFCPDTNGDGRADGVIELLEGFGGLDNPEHAGNGLMYGIDNWVYLSQHPLRLRFDGSRVEVQTTPANGQWGITQDARGRIYYTPNSDALRVDAVPHHYASRNPHMSGLAGVFAVSARDQTVWPVHATAVNRGYQPDVLRPDGSLRTHTAACGPAIYDADLLGHAFRGNAFVCEPAGNLVKRLIVKDDNGVPRASQAYPDRDFLTSTDSRFRPVNLAVGPDGALYIADMHRGLLQHKNFLTDYLRDLTRQQRLEKPIGRGRIYRIVPDSHNSGGVRGHAIGKASNDELVATLAHSDAWWRLAAQRLLIERRATGVVGRLREIMATSHEESASLHALWTLEGLAQVAVEDVLRAMESCSSALRSAGLRIAERWPDDTRVVLRMEDLANDPDRIVRTQAVLSVGAIPNRERVYVDVLGRHDADAFIRGAVVSGLAGRELAFLDRMMLAPEWPKSAAQLELAGLLADCAFRSDDGQRAGLIELIVRLASASDPRSTMVLSALGRAQRIDSQAPRMLSLAREPRGWTDMVNSGHPLSKAAMESDWFLTWPGRPHRDPPRKLRPLTDAENERFNRGRFLYRDCHACHGADGKGLPGLGPPLAGSPRVQGPATRLGRVLLHGLEGEIQREGVTYNGVMPAAPRSNDADLAALMTYIRRAWGNGADPVTEEMVGHIRMLSKNRKTPWTSEELDAVK